MCLNITLYVKCLCFKILFKEGFLTMAVQQLGWLDTCLGFWVYSQASSCETCIGQCGDMTG